MKSINNMENIKTVIGISPGTNVLGFAVFKQGELANYGTKQYRGKWSEHKLLHIIDSLKHLIELHRPEIIALKITETATMSKSMIQLLEQIASLIEEEKIKMFECSLEDIKRACCDGKVNSQEFHTCMREKYPAFSKINTKKLNWHTYYGKMFEAVGSIKALEKEA